MTKRFSSTECRGSGTVIEKRSKKTVAASAKIRRASEDWIQPCQDPTRTRCPYEEYKQSQAERKR